MLTKQGKQLRYMQAMEKFSNFEELSHNQALIKKIIRVISISKREMTETNNVWDLS